MLLSRFHNKILLLQLFTFFSSQDVMNLSFFAHILSAFSSIRSHQIYLVLPSKFLRTSITSVRSTLFFNRFCNLLTFLLSIHHFPFRTCATCRFTHCFFCLFEPRVSVKFSLFLRTSDQTDKD